MIYKSIILMFSLLMMTMISFAAVNSDSLGTDIEHQTDLYGFDENMTLQDVSLIVNISVDSLATNFKLNLKDKRIINRSLKSLKLDPEAIINYKDFTLYGFNQTNTVREIAKLLHIPVKKLMGYLQLNPQDKEKSNATLEDLQIKPSNVILMSIEFKKDLPKFGTILTVLGMSVVFFSLILTALIISQLVHFGKSKKHGHKESHSVQTTLGTVSTQKKEDLNSTAIVAVISAIHIRMHELEEENKLMLTWRRANVSMWQASGKVQFPNLKYTQYRK